ncbi:MAG: glycoside hydrolase family 95 protein, partial [Clostridia bacterium]|nr:glycoside hydrolase family 95 protein [Clostridia bacterium]
MNETLLWSPRPAGNWNEAYPLGSGRLGMMIFGGVRKERIQLNEETFWSGWEFPEYDSPETKEHLGEMRELIFAGKYTEAQRLCNRYMVCRGEGHHDVRGAYGSYQTAGELYLIYDPAADRAEPADEEVPADYRRELRLDEGLAEVRFGGTRREYFVSKAENAAVI